MKEWEKDRVWIWLIAASANHPKNNIRYYIDIKNRNLFCLKFIGDISSQVDSQDPQYQYGSENDSNYLDDCINKVKNGDNTILEISAIDDRFPFLEDPNARIFSNWKEHIEKMNDIYRRMKYSENILLKLGIEFQDIQIK